MPRLFGVVRAWARDKFYALMLSFMIYGCFMAYAPIYCLPDAPDAITMGALRTFPF
jgi:hypothetical protein